MDRAVAAGRDQPVGAAGAARMAVEHLLGTDQLGRDVLSRIIAGARVSMEVAGLVVVLGGAAGTAAGIVAGYAGGRWDALIMRVVDVQVAFPGLLLAMLMLAVIGPSLGTLVLVLAFSGWMVFARMARGVTLSLRHAPYVEAAVLLGCSPFRVLWRHLLPNLAVPLATLAVLEFAHMVLAEAALSFLGVGVQPPLTSWGLDVASGRNYVFRAWWLATFPGLAIALTVLSVNLVATWLRQISDPAEQERRRVPRAEIASAAALS
jgi:peptide/nickel transport system permease protein